MPYAHVKYRLYPTKSQERLLNRHLEILCDVYNALVNERKFLYETTGKGISQYQQEKHFTEWRQKFAELQEVHVHLLQNVALRVNNAFTSFFRRAQAGKTPGYPRFKGVGQYDSFGFKEHRNGFRMHEHSIRITKIGEIKCVVHRTFDGEPRTCVIRKDNDKWFACLAYESEVQSLPESSESVGIDLGIEKFAALSDGSFVENPRFFHHDKKELSKADRKFSQTKRGKSRRKAKKVLMRIHERIRNRRHNFTHQTARAIINRYGCIAVEKLHVQAMAQNPFLSRCIADASWSQFRTFLAYKAERAGRKLVEVNPAYTSQDCSGCGYRAKKTLKERWHHCPVCGLSLDRDTNSAFNILKTALGQQCVVGIPA